MYRLDSLSCWRAFLLCVGMLAMLVSCRPDTAYHVYQSVPDSGWTRQDTLVFELPASLPAGRYALEIGLRNTSEYAYRDIWLALLSGRGTVPGDSCTCPVDTLHLFLADSHGRWLHDGIAGSLYQSEWPGVAVCVIDSVASEPRTLRIVHLMKDAPLSGIADVGIRLSTVPGRHQYAGTRKAKS